MRALQPVRGTQDLLPEGVRRHRRVIETARAVSELYGFAEMATPIFEFTEIFARPIGEHTDIVAKEMYTFTDRGGEEVTLRPENTAGVVRAVLSNDLAQSAPLKFFYSGPMFRYERPQKGRFRQFHQIGIELIGILAFRASPVWVLAALADASGAGRYLIREISASLKDDGLLERSTEFTTVDEMLAGLEASSGRLAATINTPPLDVATLRQEWSALRRDLSRIPPKQLPRIDSLRELWAGIRDEAQKQHRSVFQVSSLMAMSYITNVPQKPRWLSASARSAARKTGVAAYRLA